VAPSDGLELRGAKQRVLLGNYELLMELASGGMATVFVARQRGAAGFERVVVVKRVHRHLLRDRTFLDMFIDEARVASSIRHANVVSVIDVVEGDEELFLVMDYVESTALSSLWRAAVEMGERLPTSVAVRIVADMLAGLHAAHEVVDMRGQPLHVVHRDVSPQNVVVGVDGVSRLLDFGIAKAAYRIVETQSGSLKGKIAYMAPEAARGEELDRRADIFAAGAVLYEAVTGQRLFEGENELDTLRRVSEAHFVAPSIVAPGLPLALDGVIARALAPLREQRFPTAAAFLEALEHAVHPAHPREVQACLERLCGARIATRRAELRSLVEGSSEPRVSRLSSSTPMPVPQEGSVRTPVVTDRSVPRLSLPSELPARPPPRRWIVGSVMAVALLTGVAVALLLTAGPPAAPSVAPAASAALPPKAVLADVELVLRAPVRIESVRAEGIRRLDLDGATARLFVAEWPGELAVEVVLEGGRSVRLAVAADGPHTLELGPSPAATFAAAPASASPPTTPLPSASAPAAPTKSSGAGRSGSELHDNPY
jgi:serine/threonine protein kinase